MNEDTELLRRYVERRDEAAFAELVGRQVNLVYSVALRQANGDAHLAADAAQLVFMDLARKAPTLLGHRVLAGWFFTSARFAAAKLVRGEQRRHAREQEAQLMQNLEGNDNLSAQLDWQRIRPVLDEVIGELGDSDREAILLRFFEGRDYASIGAKLNLAANTARMRVERALDKLRERLERRGVASTSAALATVLVQQAVTAAPTGLAATIAGAALAGGSAVGAGLAATGATATAATFMSITKLQLGLASALAVAGATGYMVQAQNNAELQLQVAALQQDTAAVDAVKAENRKLAQTLAEMAEMRRDDTQFAQLQEEAAGLKTRMQQLARLEQQRAASVRSALVYDISKLDQTPVARLQSRPQYPFEARRAGVGGEVVIDFIIDGEGNVREAKAIRSGLKENEAAAKLSTFTVSTGQDRTTAAAASPDDAARQRMQQGFEAAAVQAVSKWKFNPGRKGGQVVATHLQVPIIFSLSNE